MKSDRVDFGGVGDGDGLEDILWDIVENFGDDEGLDVLGGEEDGDKVGEEDEISEEGFVVVLVFRDVVVDEEIDDFIDYSILGYVRLSERYIR